VSKLPEVLSAPLHPNNIPQSAKWLAGEGAGSWFVFEAVRDTIEVTRYSNLGDLECTGHFKPSALLHVNKPFEVTYPSHCSKVTILQQGKRITLLPNN
jgi:hypothetical protein